MLRYLTFCCIMVMQCCIASCYVKLLLPYVAFHYFKLSCVAMYYVNGLYTYSLVTLYDFSVRAAKITSKSRWHYSLRNTRLDNSKIFSLLFFFWSSKSFRLFKAIFFATSSFTLRISTLYDHAIFAQLFISLAFVLRGSQGFNVQF